VFPEAEAAVLGSVPSGYSAEAVAGAAKVSGAAEAVETEAAAAGIGAASVA